MGRPSSYTPEIGQEICAGLIEGRSLVMVCKDLGLEYSRVFAWIGKHEEFANNYMQAREAQADYHFDCIVDIADTDEDPARARVRIDARKWVAGKMKPKKYGDTTQIRHADADGNKLDIKGILNEFSGSTSGLPRADETPE